MFAVEDATTQRLEPLMEVQAPYKQRWGRPQHVAAHRPARAAARSLLVHAVAFSWFAFVWLWHLTPAAAALPGNFGFGWFFRFLTFYSFSLQTLQLGMATLDDWQRLRRGRSAWTRPTDDLACAIFALTHVVSIMFYTIQGTTKLAVEGGHVQRPPWLDVSVHAFNTLVAWADLMTSERRTFSRTSERLSTVLVAAYLGYLMLCRHMNGRFPYPILNALSYPWGFASLIAAGLALFVAAFRAGKLMNRKLRHVSLSIRITEEERLSSSGGAAAASGGRGRAAHDSAGDGSCSEGEASGSSADGASSKVSGGGEARPVRRSYLQLAFVKRRSTAGLQQPQPCC